MDIHGVVSKESLGAVLRVTVQVSSLVVKPARILTGSISFLLLELVGWGPKCVSREDENGLCLPVVHGNLNG